MGEPPINKMSESNPRNGMGVAGRRAASPSKGVAGATERGQSPSLSAALLGQEREIRGERDEFAYAYDSDGRELYMARGRGTSVEVDVRRIPPNSVITHNHPRALGERGVLSIGNSFSDDDIWIAVKTNASELRAVTPRYTFSIRRPEGGWGLTSRNARSRYNKIGREVADELNDYAERHYGSGASYDRANAVYYHEVVKRLARQYGWEYTKKKG